ncbi:hypothetical protein B0H15DRAFT_865336, partial [Mycena belliarum]
MAGLYLQSSFRRPRCQWPGPPHDVDRDHPDAAALRRGQAAASIERPRDYRVPPPARALADAPRPNAALSFDGHPTTLRERKGAADANGAAFSAAPRSSVSYRPHPPRTGPRSQRPTPRSCRAHSLARESAARRVRAARARLPRHREWPRLRLPTHAAPPPFDPPLAPCAGSNPRKRPPTRLPPQRHLARRQRCVHAAFEQRARAQMSCTRWPLHCAPATLAQKPLPGTLLPVTLNAPGLSRPSRPARPLPLHKPSQVAQRRRSPPLV